jgi:molybdopterin synthase catalytic subunit
MVTEQNISLDMIIQELTRVSTGAVCIFTGVVRGQTERDNPHSTNFLEYESYIPMAEMMLMQIEKEIRERWPKVEGIAMIQRIGKLFPGTPTVMIACFGAHRDEGVFEASRYGIDRLKEIVPVWKKEVGPDNQVWVEGHYIPNRDDRT